ncbi:MAG: yi5B [Candidatus Brocadiaceae bacterium]|nr:yi5B [Candidatus Brocadiaceae bacterium]
MVDFVNRWSGKAEIPVRQLIRWIDISLSKFNEWRTCYGKVSEHNGWISRDTWLEEWENQAILAYYEEYPKEIFAERDRKLSEARERRAAKRKIA